MIVCSSSSSSSSSSRSSSNDSSNSNSTGSGSGSGSGSSSNNNSSNSSSNLIVVVVVVVVVAAAGGGVVVVTVRALSRFLPEEPVGGYTEVQKAWQTWTFVDFGQASSGQDGRAVAGGGRCDGLRRHGVWRNSGGRFSAHGGRWRL